MSKTGKSLSLDVLLSMPPGKCFRSGMCCKIAMCHEGLRAHGSHKRCPSLREDTETGEHSCGLVEDANQQEKARLIASLSIGAGCCSTIGNIARSQRIRNSKVWKIGDPIFIRIRLSLLYTEVSRVNEKGQITQLNLGEQGFLEITDKSYELEEVPDGYKL